MAEVTQSANAFGTTVRLDGAEDTLLALQAVEPKMYKEFRRSLSRVGKRTADAARDLAPQGVTGDMKRGYRSRLRNRERMTLVTVSNRTAQGSILEFAGSVTRGKTPQGRSLIRTLDRRYGAPGRFLWRAHDALAPYIEAEFLAAVELAEIDLQAALDRAGD